MPSVRIKRIYAPPTPDDGVRVLVDRLWPRGVTRAAAALDHWSREIAPSPALRTWFGHAPSRFAEFGDRYRRELDANIDPVAALCALIRGGTVTLLYAAHDERINHAAILAEYLEAHCRIRVR